MKKDAPRQNIVMGPTGRTASCRGKNLEMDECGIGILRFKKEMDARWASGEVWVIIR